MRPACECSVIIPTHNRAAVLRATLARLRELPDRAFEVIVLDNGSTDETSALAADHPDVRWIHLSRNIGCAARNLGAAAAEGRVLLMLDDDSHPAPGVIDALGGLFACDASLAAMACRVRLTDPPHRHDAGGVPGIFFNCGGAVRREAFLAVGGYPTDYEYYAEEYDLACKLWRNGWRVEPRGELLVWHGRVTRNRDNNRMLRLLVRNNVRMWARHAPASLRADLIESTFERYERVARKEGAMAGFEAGRAEARAILSRGVKSRPMSELQFERLMGLDRACAAIRSWADKCAVRRVAVWGRGKGCEQLLDLLKKTGLWLERVYDGGGDSGIWRNAEVVSTDAFDGSGVDGVVIGSLSPGVAEDEAERLSATWPGLPVVSPAPWLGAESPAVSSARHASIAGLPVETGTRPGALV
ncbi:MAG: hypothetical protein DCC66_05080 [Planctomycetota bacterium]|nr:MAG: hypothetical protein DCC66_05080 [Planctomycetota bacterium]